MEWEGDQNPVTDIVKRSNTKNSEAVVMARKKVKQIISLRKVSMILILRDLQSNWEVTHFPPQI